MIRSLIQGMLNQRPGNRVDGRDEMWDLGDEERQWISRMVDRVQSTFTEVENNLQSILPDAERPPRANDPDPLVRATNRYPCVMWVSLETRRLILRKVFEKAPAHAKEPRERCTGFCRLLEFNQGASAIARTLIVKMVIASLGS